MQNNLGAVLESLGSIDLAIESYTKAVQLQADYAVAHNNPGNVLTQSGKIEEAIESLASALKIKPDYVEAHNNLGVANRALGNLEEAVNSYNKAVELRPDFADAHNNLGNVLKEFGQLDKAIACYVRALKIRPGYAQAHFNMGMVYKELGKSDVAGTCFKAAIEMKPDFADAHNGLGSTLKRAGKFTAAQASFLMAVKLDPEHAEAHNNLGSLLTESGELDKAIACYTRALEIKPDYAWAQMRKLQQLAYICDWNDLESEKSRLIDARDSEPAVSPFAMLALEDNPESHKERAENYAVKNFGRWAQLDFASRETKRDRIHIAYFSADFKDHPVGRLMARVFELHDRSIFVVHAFSYSSSNDFSLTQRFKKAFDEFHDVNDVNDLADEEIAQLAREEGIDIAIDLTGFMKGSRTGIFAFRAAPIQINYLGYPGTMGSTFMDYIIADSTIIPLESTQYYAEKIIRLPKCYQAQDNTVEVSQGVLTRAEFGLPESGFVFCCFNNSYKISKSEFDIWMRLLARVDGSVLWLYEANEWAKANLLLEAKCRGIGKQRLIFSSGTFHADYLARLRLADLFLDTFNYNAGATASDALWAGLPVLTKKGEGYTARMASSLLKSIQLAELITDTKEAYENLALELSNDHLKLKSIRKKLAMNRDSTPLFDSESFTANLEMAYQKVHARYLSGGMPKHVSI